MFGLFRKNQPMEPGVSQIVPRIKNLKFLQVSRDFDVGPGDKPVTEPLVGDLLVTYAFDLGEVFTMVRPWDCERLGLSRPQLRRLAVENLRGQVGQIHSENLAEGRLSTPLFMLVTGNELEACLLLLDEVWEPLSRQVVGELVVAVPTRNVVYVSGTRSPEALQVIREAILEAQSHERTHSLTRNLLVRRGHRWEVYAPQPPPLPPGADEDDRYKPPSERRGSLPPA